MAADRRLDPTPASSASLAAPLGPARKGDPLRLAAIAVVFPLALCVVLCLLGVIENTADHYVATPGDVAFVLLAPIAMVAPFVAAVSAARARKRSAAAPDQRLHRRVASAVLVLAVLEILTVVPFVGCGALYVADESGLWFF